MDIEEMMIDYIMNHASNEEIQEFFGYADHMYGLRHMMDHSAAGLENQFLRQRF